MRSVDWQIWRELLQRGDWVVLVTSLLICLVLTPYAWRGGMADRVLVRSEGKTHAEVDLQTRRMLEVPGPLGTTQILIEPGRVRVLADPGPRQYCVRQGWLTRPGEIAICAPNRVSVQVLGRTSAYDSLSY